MGQSQKRASFLLGQAFWSEIGSPFWLVVQVFGPAQELHVVRNVVCWAKPLLGSQSMRDPGFMNLIGAPDSLGDSGRIVWGIFVLTAGARERTRGCSPRDPGRFGQNRLGDFCLDGGCARAHPWM